MDTKPLLIEKPHSKTVDEVLSELETSVNGLSDEEVRRRLEIYGPNEIEEKARFKALRILINQFKDIFVMILIVAVLISYFIEHSVVDSITIGAIVILNTIVGFVQEYRSEKAIEAMKQLTAPKVWVIRNGQPTLIPAKEVVPGDILILEEGTKIAADARLIEAIELKVNEASLTGESTPVKKSVDPLPEDSDIVEMKNMVFMGTFVAFGRGKAVVTHTGFNTMFGKIAKHVQEIEEVETPLKRKLSDFAKKLAKFTILIVALIFVLEWIREGQIIESFMVAIALAVSAVPEGLPAVVTITLALSARELTKKNAYVKRLASAETLGSTTVICSDKTGTITKGEMTVRKIYVNNSLIDVTGVGYSLQGEFLLDRSPINPNDDIHLYKALLIGTLCNNAKIENGQPVGDTTEVALVVVGMKGGLERNKIEEHYQRIGEIPFSSERKRMSVIYRVPNGKIEVYVKGAPEIVLERCKYILEDGKVKPLSEEKRNEINKINDSMAEQALRSLALAYKEIEVFSGEFNEEELENDLILVGIVGMIDPPRDEVYDAVEKAKRAGIKIVMITGDHKLTAVAIAKEIGIMDENGIAVTGKELEQMSDEEFLEKVEKITVYARVSPLHKLRIVNALKAKGHIVAMTGDGVNDAPALKRADIGIAMGITGTDVAKEASDMILADDNFATIVKAVEGGRIVYNNIRKFVRYLLACNFDELTVITVAALLGWPIPLLPAMILWINLVTDGAPAVALSVDPPDEDVMNQPPRDPKAGVLHGMLLFIFVSFLLQSIGTLGIFYVSYFLWNEPVEEARTMAFIQAAFFELFVIWNVRSEKHSVFRLGFKGNKFLLISVIVAGLLTASLTFIEPFTIAFHLVPLTLYDWILVIAISSVGLLVLPEFLMNRKFLKWM
ncbi:MAG: calcium-translocating P-type ATPase, SERCA-type [Candidatus Odinarchaeota archaeon]|nr:calcium-translocating P-type ATPase, SERCA-type [Candidatus Odinarchaeota archaeon]